MAFTAVVALASAETVTAAMVFAAVAEVGVALTVMGAVTGDKNMMSTGSMMSMVGGIGGAAAGSSLFNNAAGEVAGSVAGDAAAGVAAEGVAGTAAAAPAADAAIASTGVQDAALNGATGGAAAGAGFDPLAEQAAAGMAPAGTLQAGTAANVMPVGASQAVTSGVNAPGGIMDPAAAFDPMSAVGGVAQSAGKTDSNSFFSGIGKVWDGLGPQGKAAAVQLVGGAFAGAAETERHNDMMDFRNRELDLRSHGSAVARYNKTGIINSART